MSKFPRTPRHLRLAGGLALAVAALGCSAWLVDWAGLKVAVERMPPVPAVAAMALLPLAGLSISLVYFAAGAIFGGPTGLLVVAAVTAIHLLGTHAIAHGRLRRRLRDWLQRKGRRVPEIPEGDEAAVALMVALVPGLPYGVRNYLLALSGVPLKVYFWICWPTYVLRSTVVIFLGDIEAGRDLGRLTVLGLVYGLKLGICAWLVYRLRRRHRAAYRAAFRAVATRSDT